MNADSNYKMPMREKLLCLGIGFVVGFVGIDWVHVPSFVGQVLG